MKELVSTQGMDKQEWLLWRRKGIGGSDAAALCGVSPYRTEMDVFLDKKGLTGECVENDAMYFGKRLEGIVAEEFQRRSGLSVTPFKSMLQHEDHDYILANIDRLVMDEDALLECKTAGLRKKEGWADGAVPEEYMLQVQHYLAVTGLDLAYIACLIGGQEFVWCAIERNDDLISNLLEVEVAFWNNHIVPNIAPEPTQDNMSESILKLLYPKGKGTTIVLGDDKPELKELAERMEKDGIELKELKKKVEKQKNMFKGLMGENETALCGNIKMTWNTEAANRFDTAALKEAEPNMYKKYFKEDNKRTFRIRRVG